ncbi:hypothetical protein G9A89_023339 [Geosiphon pyriformis]|nr:hypothetical protein G9A89_023339 [Geosiphon pyriformis]
MNTPGTVIKIFWPTHVCSSETSSGFLVGWNVRSFTICVAAIISDVKLRDLESTLSALSTDNRSSFVHMSEVCGAPPIVLGFLTVDSASDFETERIFHVEDVSEKSKTANLWVTVHLQHNNMISLRSIDCCGYRYSSVSAEIIFYKQPNPTLLQYLSLEPLVLDISKNNHNKMEKESITIKNMKKITNTRIRSSTKQQLNKSNHANDLERVLNQINSSHETERAIRIRCKPSQIRRSRRSASVSQTVKKSAVGLGILLKRSIMYPLFLLRPILAHPILYLLVLVRVFAEIVLWILNFRFPNSFLNGIALKDFSATAQQIDLRLQQACFWPWQFMLQRRRDWTNISTTRAQYISFYNSMWLVANDIIIGVALGCFLMDNNEAIAKLIVDDYLNHYTIERLEKMVIWLMGWPAGLKLNSELDKFLGELFLWLILLWKGCIYNIGPVAPTIIRMIGISGFFGASMVLSLLSDFLSFMTLHIYSFYMVAARIFNWQPTILYSLFNLFRGKKWNTLRNRIDSCDYDLDQLLLGTILFTLITFLFPTIVVFYAIFALSRVGVIFLQVVMETLLAFLNHFPLFAILLRFTDPERLPGGLRFEKCDPNHFAIYEMPLARVFEGLKSFWPWSSNIDGFPLLKTLIPPILKNEIITTDITSLKFKPFQINPFGNGNHSKETDESKTDPRQNRIKKISINGFPPPSTTPIMTSITPISTTSLPPNIRSAPRVSYLFMKVTVSAISEFTHTVISNILSIHAFVETVELSLFFILCVTRACEWGDDTPDPETSVSHVT